MATDMVARVASSILSEIGRCFGHQFGYFINYNNNIKNFKDRADKLELKLKSVQSTVNAAKRNGEVILPDIEGWLGNVAKLSKEAARFLEHDVVENKGCLNGWCPNVKAWYLLSRKAKKMTREVIELQNQGDGFKKIAEPPHLIGIEITSPGNFRSFHSRDRITQQVKDIVKGSDFHMIAICGLGGVGKTTLIKEVEKWAHENKLFDEIVMSVVSRNPSFVDLQGELAVKLGLTLTEQALGGRAEQLWDRLLRNSQRNLVILDDVWKCIDLRKIGIPVGDGNKKNTIVLTSRFEEVCETMGCDKIIKVDVLPENEAWILFKDMAGGITVDAPDYIEVASKIAAECRGLPIAIVTVGSALKGKQIEVWNDAYLKLSQSIVPTNLPEVEEKVFKSLQFSYDQVNFEEKEAGSIFLLCCLYQEDANIPLEDLVRYGMGRKLFKGIKLVMEARDRVHALIEKLQKCFLLLDGDHPCTVKMHDVVRDVGICIASENDYFKMMVVTGRWEMDAAYEHCNALSVISSEITELPVEGLNCPGLDLLHMSCNQLSTENLNVGNVMFEGMKKLRVLSMFSMSISSLPSSLQLLANLRVLNLEYCSSLTDTYIPEQLVNLEILSLRGCRSITKVPTEMKRLIKLRVLDMRECSVNSVSTGVILSMCQLEELYTETWPWDEQGNASLNELESLRNLTIIMTGIRWVKFLPKHFSVPEKLRRYYIKLGEAYFDSHHSKLVEDFRKYPFFKKSLVLSLNECTEAPIGLGVIGKLLKQSAEHVFLQGDGLVNALNELAAEGFRHLRELRIQNCDNDAVEYLASFNSTAKEWANMPNSSFGVFTKLETLDLGTMSHLKAIVSCCHDGKLEEGLFENLKEIKLNELPELTHLWKYGPTNTILQLRSLQSVHLYKCARVKYLFTLSESASLKQLNTLEIQYCKKIEAVILEELEGSSSAATIEDGVEVQPSNNNVIKFTKLERLILTHLDNLTCFRRVIEFPQLKELELWYLDKHECLASVFNHKQVMFPSLEKLTVSGMACNELWGSHPPSLFPKLKFLTIRSFSNIASIIPMNSAQYLSGLISLSISACPLLEEVFETTRASFDRTILFENLRQITVWRCGRLKNLCSSSVARNIPNLVELIIIACESMEEVIVKEEGVEEDEIFFPHLKKCNLKW